MIQIRSKNNIRIIYDNKSNSILSKLEKNHIEVEFQCRSGYCGACRLQLLTGKVRYFQEPIAYLKKGEILPCCCFPIDDLEITI